MLSNGYARLPKITFAHEMKKNSTKATRVTANTKTTDDPSTALNEAA
jgi:hypothetical protein